MRGYDAEYDRNRRALVEWARGVWRGGGTVGCCLCGRPVAGPRDLTAEHLVPLAAGGTSDASNLAPAHRSCNFARRKPL